MNSEVRILVVEDDHALRRLLVAVLRNDGYDVGDAVDGWELADRVDAMSHFGGELDLIISDVRLPGPSALATLGRDGLPCATIFMSAFPDVEVQMRVRRLGAPLFHKPFDFEDLRTCVVHMVQAERPWRPQKGL